jgi:hypothetical protein
MPLSVLLALEHELTRNQSIFRLTDGKFRCSPSKGGDAMKHELNPFARAALELTRFSGHLILWLQGVHHAENPTAVPT